MNVKIVSNNYVLLNSLPVGSIFETGGMKYVKSGTFGADKTMVNLIDPDTGKFNDCFALDNSEEVLFIGYLQFDKYQ